MAETAEHRRRVAAVSPIRARNPAGLEVLLVKRAQHLNSHAGEVGLPGGMAEPYDADLWHTALREAEEEVGAGGGFSATTARPAPCVHPPGGSCALVAAWRQEHPLNLCADEIESAFGCQWILFNRIGECAPIFSLARIRTIGRRCIALPVR